MVVVQYSPQHPEAVDQLKKSGFLYQLESGREGVTSINKVRRFADQLHVVGITKNLIIALLMNSGGYLLGEAMNTYGHRLSLCFINVDKFKNAVFIAILAGQLQARSPQLLISDELVDIGNEMRNGQARRGKLRGREKLAVDHLTYQLPLPFQTENT